MPAILKTLLAAQSPGRPPTSRRPNRSQRPDRRAELPRPPLAGPHDLRLRCPAGRGGGGDQLALPVGPPGGGGRGSPSIASCPNTSFSPPLSPGRPGRDGVGVPERRDDPALVRAAMANRRLASNPRHGGPGRASGVEYGPPGEAGGPTGPDLHRFCHGRCRRLDRWRRRRR